MRVGDFVYIVQRQQEWSRRDGSVERVTRVPGRISRIVDGEVFVTHYGERHHLERGSASFSLYTIPVPRSCIEPREPFEDDPFELWSNEEAKLRGMEDRERAQREAIEQQQMEARDAAARND